MARYVKFADGIEVGSKLTLTGVLIWRREKQWSTLRVTLPEKDMTGPFWF